jgi:outer membrane protein OmpA-like peptidoglycan-associated protein
MRILIIGFLVFCGWSALSTWIYVCKIKGLCGEPIAVQADTVSQKAAIAIDTIAKPAVQEQAVIPENLVIYFAFDKSDFTPDAKTNKFFDESKAYLDQNLQARLNITGYTDAVGTDQYNQTLGYKRAQNVQKYFESKGIPADKIVTESKGEKEPADDNNTTTGRANNRRTVLTIKK